MHSHTSPATKLILFTLMVNVISLVSAECPVNCYCSRYNTFCDLAKLNTLPSLLPSTTQYVRIEADHIPEINNSIITHSGLHDLTRLDLINVLLQDIQPGAFQNMSQLEYLLITQNQITVLKTNSFKYLQNLYFLKLSHNEIWNLESGTFSGLSELRHLDLRYNYIYFLKASVFKGLKVTGNCDLRQVPIIYNQVLHNVLSYLSRSPDSAQQSEPVINNTSKQGDPEVLKHLCSLTYFAVDYQTSVNYTYYSSYLNKHLYLLSVFGSSYPNIHIPYHMSSGLTLRAGKVNTIIIYNSYSTALFYLDLSATKLSSLANGSFQNLEKLKYLDVSNNDIKKIPNGAFQGLVSLKTLKINNNWIKTLDNGAFTGLNSLKWLEMSSCNISTIENNAFKGLAKLQLLDLSDNPLHILKNNTFSGLHMLKHLKLDKIIIKRIDSNTFSHLTHLKTLSNTYNLDLLKIQIENSQRVYKLISRSNMQMFKTEKETFLYLDRLDSLELTAHISLAKQMQVLKSLHLYIDATLVDPQQELRDILQSVHYVQELNITLLGVNSTRFLTTLSGYKIFSLTLLNSNLKVLHNNSLSGLPTSKTLIIFDKTYSIENGAFHEMTSLTELILAYESDLTYREGSFHGLHNLKQLSIFIPGRPPPDRNLHDHNISKCLYKGTFVGLDNLKRLVLTGNTYACLNPGAFQGLYNIEEISLNDNYIEAINAGVFGAECKKEFKLSCKNVTLTEYCNNTNALTTLKYLNLHNNIITHIHPHAFIGCNNLHTLDLSVNRFVTLYNLFLFTPALRKLNMNNCGTDHIPNNNTFECTPLLSHIDFSGNFDIKHLTLSTLLPLRHLQFINVVGTSLLCNCEQYETWLWMRQHHVHYTGTCIADVQLYDGDKVFPIMHCNKTLQHTIRNNVTITTDDFEFFKMYVEPLVLIIILISSLACNGFLLFISLYHKDMRKQQNALVIHLAIVDVLSLILHLPLSYWDTVNVIWEFDNTVCKIFILSKDMAVAVNVASVVTLCVERFLVTKTLKNLKKSCVAKRIPTTWLIVMSWISGIVTSLPAYFSARVVEGRCLYCPPTYENYIRNVWTFQLIMYCLTPAAVIAFLNIKTSNFLRESVSKIPGEIKNNSTIKNRKIVANVMLILAVVFVISYLPSYVLRVLVAWSIVDMNRVLLPAFFTYCLFFCSTVFNPISLFIISSKFKSYALRHLPFLTNEQNT